MIFFTLDLHGAVSYGQGYILPDGAEEIAEDEYHAALAAARAALLEPPISEGDASQNGSDAPSK